MTNEIQEEIKALPEEEFRNLRLWLLDEVKRRENAMAIARAEADLVRELQDAGKLDRPAAVTGPAEDFEQVPEWTDPGTDHSRMYQYGDIVRYENRLVRSTHQGLNHWRPGELGFDGRIWEDITPREVDTPSNVSAWQAGSTYNAGDKVEYSGRTWRVLQTHTAQAGWEPTAVPALFEQDD